MKLVNVEIDFNWQRVAKPHPCKQEETVEENQTITWRGRLVSGYHTVDVSCTASVMTWEGCLHLDDSFSVTLLDAAEEGRVEVSLIPRVAVSTGNDSRIDTL